jgi:hypothetical protein
MSPTPNAPNASSVVKRADPLHGHHHIGKRNVQRQQRVFIRGKDPGSNTSDVDNPGPPFALFITTLAVERRLADRYTTTPRTVVWLEVKLPPALAISAVPIPFGKPAALELPDAVTGAGNFAIGAGGPTPSKVLRS